MNGIEKACRLAGIREMADRCGITRQVVWNWRRAGGLTPTQYRKHGAEIVRVVFDRSGIEMPVEELKLADPYG